MSNRRIRFRSGAYCLALVPLLYTLRPASAAGQAVIHGTVTNGSLAPPRSVDGVSVVLDIYRHNQAAMQVRALSDRQGHFTLSVPVPVPLSRGGATATYRLVAAYKHVTYSLEIPSAALSQPVSMKVYDTASSDNGLAAMRVGIGIRRTGRGAVVIERWTYINPTSRTVLAPATFPLPPGATQAAIYDRDPRGSARVQAGAIVVNDIVRPATGLNASSFHQVSFTFVLPGGADHPTLLFPTRYLIGRLDLLAIGSQLDAPGFKPTMLSDGAHQIPALEALGVAPGSTLMIGIDGPPGPAPFPVAPVIVAIEAGFLGLLLWGIRGRLPGLRGAGDQLMLQRERARLIGAIAELDAQHERGGLGAADYRRRRARQKGRLLNVARQLGE